ncbi:MAG TPA: YqiA/YcfP family alpha/beta fold hydrolase [Burkholderiaceae bacterium]|nr:YqiA/YcfP family alpha/beta fold hydrolase [Burkholderiaceae bacterium]
MTAVTASTTHLLYLHGFRSSPKSFKAQRMADWLARQRPGVRWWCPQLPPSPREAMDLVFAELARWPVEHMAVMGSSLGGFYATVVAERTGCRAVLLNPAVNPARDLAGYIGDLTSYHDPDDHFYFRPEYVTQLRVMTPRAVTRPERYLAVIAKGDEVLDWREMSARYPGASLRLLEGGDHALSDFDTHLPAILRHLQLCD